MSVKYSRMPKAAYTTQYVSHCVSSSFSTESIALQLPATGREGGGGGGGRRESDGREVVYINTGPSSTSNVDSNVGELEKNANSRLVCWVDKAKEVDHQPSAIPHHQVEYQHRNQACQGDGGNS